MPTLGRPYKLEDIETTARGPLKFVQGSTLHDAPESYQDLISRKFSTEWIRVKEVFSVLAQSGGPDWRSAIDICRFFASFVRNKETGIVRVTSNHCRNRWCPMCASSRANAVSAQVQEWLNKASFPKMLTLTLAHSDRPLFDQIKELYSAFRKLRKLKYFRERVKGGIWFFQVPRSKDRTAWHPHLHCVIEGDFIDNNWIAREWLRITGHSKIIHVTLLRDFKAAAKEIARYASRPNRLENLSDESACELVRACRSLRTCGTWGSGRSCSLRPQIVYDKDEWESIGSWQTVISLKETCEAAALILHAYVTKQPLDPDITCVNVDKFTKDFELGSNIDEEIVKFYTAYGGF
jgi:hypothetical protein